MFKPGDLVLYELKNELGVVKRQRDDNTSFCFYHLGGTASATPNDLIRRLNVEEVLQMEFSNNYAVNSLLERSVRIKLDDKPYDDLIDTSDVRPNIGGIIVNLFEGDSNDLA